MSTGELACTYATLILYDDGIVITAEFVLQAFEKRSADELIQNVGSGGAPVAVAAPAAASGGLSGAAPAAAVEEKKLQNSDRPASFFQAS